MKRRSYQRDSDIELLQAFTAAAIAETDGFGYEHPGDIPHRLFNGNRLFDPGEVMTIWEDGDGVAAFVLAGPRHRSFDARVRPELRGGDFECEVYEYAEMRTLDLMRAHGIEGDRIGCAAYRGDTDLEELLTELGWTLEEGSTMVVNRRPLVDLLEPKVPDGYVLRAAAGPGDAAALAAVHAGSFGTNWTPESYRTLMQTPGYAAEREFVAEAADGSFAAFTLTWHDGVNRMGLFEPVGTHSEHRRRGLGRALIQFALRRMVEAGMRYATAVNEEGNEAAQGLYRACGFKPVYHIDDYFKPVPILLGEEDPDDS